MRPILDAGVAQRRWRDRMMRLMRASERTTPPASCNPSGKLTDVDLARISGDRACLTTYIQKRYDLSSVHAEQQIRTFEARS